MQLSDGHGNNKLSQPALTTFRNVKLNQLALFFTASRVTPSICSDKCVENILTHSSDFVCQTNVEYPYKGFAWATYLHFSDLNNVFSNSSPTGNIIFVLTHYICFVDVYIDPRTDFNTLFSQVWSLSYVYELNWFARFLFAM